MLIARRHDTPGQSSPDTGPSNPFRSLPVAPLADRRRTAVMTRLRFLKSSADFARLRIQSEPIEDLIEEVCGGRWGIGKKTARALAVIFANVSPARVLEFGSGTSTLILAALAKHAGQGGHIVSVDENPQYASKTRTLLEKFDVADHATVIMAPVVRRSLGGWRGYTYQPDPQLMAAAFGGKRADLVFIDGPASWMKSRADCRFGTLLTARDWLADGAVFVADDVFRAREESILRRWSHLPSVRVDGIVPVGRGLGIGVVDGDFERQSAAE